jgi:membrane-bound serine protease (ClpP class)
MPTLDTYQPSLRERFLSILSNPNLFYLLFLAGMIGLGFELTHPGSLFPGVVGGICMILALMATATLPVNFGAMLLVLAGVAFLVAEMFLPSFGILGIGGLAAFAIGSTLLVDPNNEQGLRISLWLILPGTAVVGGTAFLAGWLVLKAARERTYSGQEGITGL